MSMLDHLVTPVTTTIRPNVLIFGDTRACPGTKCTHQTKHFKSGPAFMPYGATSGLYLLKCLLEVSWGAKPLAEMWPAFANAADVDVPTDVWESYGRPPVIALGVNAHKVLNSYKLSHAVVPHPQYVRRFHHSATAEYGRLILDAIGTERNELKWRPTSTESRDVTSTPAFSST